LRTDSSQNILAALSPDNDHQRAKGIHADGLPTPPTSAAVFNLSTKLDTLVGRGSI
jgi:hypothetical protein